MGRSKKTLFINPKFQIKLIGYFFTLSIITMSVFYSSVVYFFMEFKEVAQNLALPENHVFYKFLAQQKTKMDAIFFVTSFISLFILLFGGVMMSHKIAGPVYRLCQYLKSWNSVEKDKNKPLTFRKNDFFPEIPEILNNVLNNNQKDEQRDNQEKAS